MPDQVFTYRMPAGIAGEVSRFQTYGATIEQAMVNTTAAVTGAALSPPSWAYGAMVVVDSNGARPIVAGDSTFVQGQFVFSLVRPFPGGDIGVAFPTGVVGFGAGSPRTAGIVDVMRRGYMTLKLGGAAAASKGAPVYLYYGVSTGAHVQGALEAAAGSNLVLLPNAFFEGAADAGGITEIGFNI